MNVLKTIDKNTGLQRGKVMQEVWLANLQKFMDNDFDALVDKINDAIKNELSDPQALRKLANDLYVKIKSLGLYRLSMILDSMQRAVNDHNIQQKTVDLQAYRAWYLFLL